MRLNVCIRLIQASSEQRIEEPAENISDEEACKEVTEDQRIEVRFRIFHEII